MDSFAVSLAAGISNKRLGWMALLRAAIFLGAFQAMFAGFGLLLSQSFKEMVAHIDHWIAFALLVAIGGKMIWESFKSKPGDKSFNVENYLILIGLSIATSIDALMVGMSLGFLETPLFSSVLVIGAVTIILSVAGFIIGIKNGFRLLENKAELIGGLILAGIGIKVLVQHL